MDFQQEMYAKGAAGKSFHHQPPRGTRVRRSLGSAQRFPGRILL